VDQHHGEHPNRSNIGIEQAGVVGTCGIYTKDRPQGCDVAHDGLKPEVNLEIVDQPPRAEWSRSLFNGLAQVIVQSTRDTGEIKLSASADGLAPATTVVQTLPCAPRPSVP
jgi:hypothetical protein